MSETVSDKLTGSGAELMAQSYLKKKRFRIEAVNLRIAGAEIDILAIRKKLLLVVEVKKRESVDHGFPSEFVDQAKQSRLIRAARVLMARREYREMMLRFDVITVCRSGEKYRIDHLENAFEEE